MVWSLNVLRQEELKLPKEMVDKVAMAVGNGFLSLGLIAPLGVSEKAGAETSTGSEFLSLLRISEFFCFI